MGVTVIPAPVQGQTGNILDFLLQMSSLDERKKYRRVQERYTSMAERQLGLKEKAFAADEPIRKEARITAEYRADVKGGMLLTRRKRAEIKRTLDVAIGSGDTDTADASRFLLKKLDNMIKNDPILPEWAFFAEEKGKEQTAENQLLRGQVFSANQEAKTVSSMFDFYKMQTGALLDGIKNMSSLATESGVKLTGEAIDNALAGGSATEIAKLMAPGVAGEAAAKLDAARQKPWPDPADFTQKQVAAWDKQSLWAYKDAFRNTGRGIETMTLPRPRGTGRALWFDSAELTLTRPRAVELDVVDQWDAVKRQEAAKVQPKDKGLMPGSIPPTAPGMRPQMPIKKKSVRELANERAKKVTPTGTKKGAATKSPYPQYPDAFIENGVWKVIVDGVKYRIED